MSGKTNSVTVLLQTKENKFSIQLEIINNIKLPVQEKSFPNINQVRRSEKASAKATITQNGFNKGTSRSLHGTNTRNMSNKHFIPKELKLRKFLLLLPYPVNNIPKT